MFRKEDIFDWITLSAFVRNKVIKSMSYWLFITPVLANAFDKVNSINLDFIGVDGPIYLTLPFSWVLFFFSALFFGIGNLIYILKCPELIKDYENFTDYFNKQKSTHYLVESFRRTIKNNESVKANRSFQELKKLYSNDGEENLDEIINNFKGVGNEGMPNFYSNLKLILKDQFKAWRVCATYSYLIGFILIGLVIIQNLLFVIDNIV